MIKATPENVFVGSVVEKKGELLNVYKVNKNFVWAGKAPSGFIQRDWDHKEKGTTWLNIMEENKGKKLNFNNLMLDETATENIFEKKSISAKKEEKRGKYVNACCIKKLKNAFDNYKNKKNYRGYLECTCDNILFILQGSEEGTLIFRNDYNQLKFDYNTEEVTLYKDLSKVD